MITSAEYNDDIPDETKIVPKKRRLLRIYLYFTLIVLFFSICITILIIALCYKQDSSVNSSVSNNQQNDGRASMEIDDAENGDKYKTQFAQKSDELLSVDYDTKSSSIEDTFTNYESTFSETEDRDKYETLSVQTTEQYDTKSLSTEDTFEIITKLIPTSTINAKPLGIDNYESTFIETKERDTYETLSVQTTEQYDKKLLSIEDTSEITTELIPTTTTHAKPLNIDKYELTLDETEKIDKYVIQTTTDEYYDTKSSSAKDTFEITTKLIPISTTNAKPLSIDNYEFTFNETKERDDYETLPVQTTEHYDAKSLSTEDTYDITTKLIPTTTTHAKPLIVDKYELTLGEKEKIDKYEIRTTTDEYYDTKLSSAEDVFETTSKLIPTTTRNIDSMFTTPLSVDNSERYTEMSELLLEETTENIPVETTDLSKRFKRNIDQFEDTKIITKLLKDINTYQKPTIKYDQYQDDIIPAVSPIYKNEEYNLNKDNQNKLIRNDFKISLGPTVEYKQYEDDKKKLLGYNYKITFGPTIEYRQYNHGKAITDNSVYESKTQEDLINNQNKLTKSDIRIQQNLDKLEDFKYKITKIIYTF